MDTFFCYLKKTLVATVFVMFGLVATYIPQDWNKVQIAEAGSFAAATFPEQLVQDVNLLMTNISTSISAAFDKITAWATASEWAKSSILDGIAWKMAKAIVSSMVQSLINWINSGFKGSPMFVQDLAGFLRNAADAAIGEYISELGGLGSFLCDPFKLDIQVAVALEYQRLRSDQPAPKCTLSGIINNIEGFIDGTVGSFDKGGWDDWFDITSNPTMYTPYGAELAAKSGAYVRILNSKGEEAAKVSWGGGFLSGEICEVVHGSGTSKEECFISKPGKVIQEALSFNLDSGRQSLIAADEIDEIIAALLGQLANQALTGAAGLLGLSGGTGYTYSGFTGGSYLNQMSQDSLGTAGVDNMKDALAIQVAYGDLAADYQSDLQDYADDVSNPKAKRAAAKTAAADAGVVMVETSADILKLDGVSGLISQYENTTDPVKQAEIISQFNKLTLYTQNQMDNSQLAWDNILDS